MDCVLYLEKRGAEFVLMYGDENMHSAHATLQGALEFARDCSFAVFYSIWASESAPDAAFEGGR